MTARTLSLVLLAAGLVLLAAELYRAPATTVIGITTFGSVWIVRRRLVRRRHRHLTRLYRVRREVVTSAVLTMLLVTLASLLFAGLDVSADVLSGSPAAASGAAADAQTPWAATFLLDGFLTVVAVAWTCIGAFSVFRRATPHHPSSPPAPLAG